MGGEGWGVRGGVRACHFPPQKNPQERRNEKWEYWHIGQIGRCEGSKSRERGWGGGGMGMWGG